MKLTDLLDRERAFRYVVGFVLAVSFLVAVSVPARSLAVFYGHLDALSESVRRGDFAQAEANLGKVTAFYEESRGWGLEWLVDAYLFRDAFLQQASYSYLTGDYEVVVQDLADELDDSLASHLRASARFQLARNRYRVIATDDPKREELKAAIIQEVLEEISSDYERALRSDQTNRFEYKWNYDLTTDAEAIRLALEPLQSIEPPELEQMRGHGTPVRRRRG